MSNPASSIFPTHQNAKLFVDEQIAQSGLAKAAFSISGMTATGKTDLALSLANHLLAQHPQFTRVDIISADSRQVYSDIPITSGADVPDGFRRSSDTNLQNPFFTSHADQGEINLHGVGILDADQDWSVAHFQDFALPVIEHSWQNKGIVLIVGGTGLYHAHLFNPRMKTQPGPDVALREELFDLSVQDLQRRLLEINKEKWHSMNESDRANPRRIIRAIEQTIDPTIDSTMQTQSATIPLPNLYKTIVVSADLESVAKKIAARVQSRITQGAVQEIKNLQDKLADLQQKSPELLQIVSATGVSELIEHVSGETSLEQAIEKWIIRERKYAKQQQTWWKSHLINLMLE